MDLISLFGDSILSNNIALTFILGMCPLIAISTNVKNAAGMGVAVIFVVTITATINYPLYWILSQYNATELSMLIFIITIASTVQFLELFLEKYIPRLYNAFGIYLPLITVNCVVLAVSLFFVNREYTFIETTVFSFGSAVGWFIAIVLLAAVREKMATHSNVPKGLAGKAITFFILGMLSLAFSGFAGLFA